MLESEAVTVLHICAGWEQSNGAANIARMIAGEQAGNGFSVAYRVWAKVSELRAADEVWIHCAWMPCLWWAALWAKRYKWMPEASYDPVRLGFHGWKKWLAGPVERFFLRRADAIVATCEAEAEWIREYEPRVKKIEVTDVKRFFRIENGELRGELRIENGELRIENGRGLHLLYLGRRHPLKGVEYLERALRELRIEKGELRIEDDSVGSDGGEKEKKIVFRVVSDAFGEEKEKVWEWCDVLVLPTLSENFGLVVAEALERGKRVITTDGAPAWDDGNDYGGRLVCLRGFRNGTDEERVALLKGEIGKLVASG